MSAVLQMESARKKKLLPFHWYFNHDNNVKSQTCIKLTRKPQTGGDTRHGKGHQMVEITISRSGELQCPEADVIEGLIVDAKGLISVLN